MFIEIGKRTEDHGIRCTISELVTRSDVHTYNNKVKSVNKKLKDITAKTIIGFVEQINIDFEQLNFEALHLNKRGDGAFALNFICYIRDWEEQVSVHPNRKNIGANNSFNILHEPNNELWGVSLKKCSETATVKLALRLWLLILCHIIGITETKIDTTIQNSDIEIDDYVIERNDKDKHGGGVAPYN